jgi:LmbE family N-acetylglucosaminyl deacetylase
VTSSAHSRACIGRRPALMAVHAHPDDESSQTGGTLARYAAAGYRTVLIICTDGGQGDDPNGAKAGQPGHDPQVVARRRSVELDRAAIALNVSDTVTLGYPDSGVLQDSPRVACTSVGAFSQLALEPLVLRIEQLMWIYRPDVVLTYPPNGLSGHPDHVRTHDVVATAHRNIVDKGGFPPADCQGTVHKQPPPRLYYIAVSNSRLQAVRRTVRAALGPDAWIPPAEMAIDDSLITTVIDVGEFWEHKLRALSAHASQPDAAALLHMFAAAASPGVATGRVEEYVRAYPPVTDTTAEIEHDFFPDSTHPNNAATCTDGPSSS